MIIEEWRDVEGYGGAYRISSYGAVKSMARTKRGKGGSLVQIQGILLKHNTDKDGYLTYGLSKNGVVKTLKAHRLVGLHFISNPKNKPHINHIDEVKNNNNIINLEWATRSENATHGTAIARSASKRSIRVEQIENGVVVKVWGSAAEAGRSGYCRSKIVSCCSGNRKSSGGYQWRHATKELA